MSRYARRVDDNHAETAAAIRAAGYSVLSLAPLGNGAPDLLVGGHGDMWLMEVKKRGPQGGMSSGARRSLKGEREWAATWRGRPVLFVDGPEHALQALGATGTHASQKTGVERFYDQ